jgi:UDP-N-acetylmuramyl tripeptide synthase
VNILLILFGKTVSLISRVLGMGNGSTWPGHIALNTNKNFIRDLLRKSGTKVILIAGTNGKTTTASLINNILKESGATVLQNASGANLLNGIASALLLNSNVFGKIEHEYAVFEVDENALPAAISETQPSIVLLLNLFRDQLDRYGEVNSIAKKWQSAVETLPQTTTVIANADDPQIAHIGMKARNTKYFGLDDKSLSTDIKQHASDTTHCPSCGKHLIFERVYFSHIGIWRCTSCKLKRPTPEISKSPSYPLPGTYNRYNTIAAVLTAKILNIKGPLVETALKQFKPAFGRQEIIELKNGKKAQIFLSKNPTSLNESLRTVRSLGGKNVLFVLNDRVPDGRDVSWIWDVDFEEYVDDYKVIFVTGDRPYDMAVRLKYALSSVFEGDPNEEDDDRIRVNEFTNFAVNIALQYVPQGETLYIFPTYSAMLEVRRVLTGKKIL